MQKSIEITTKDKYSKPKKEEYYEFLIRVYVSKKEKEEWTNWADKYNKCLSYMIRKVINDKIHGKLIEKDGVNISAEYEKIQEAIISNQQMLLEQIKKERIDEQNGLLTYIQNSVLKQGISQIQENKSLSQRILDQLDYHIGLDLSELSDKLQEPSKKVLEQLKLLIKEKKVKSTKEMKYILVKTE